MSTNALKRQTSNNLRRKAIKKFQEKADCGKLSMTFINDEATQKLIYELQVHQIELEMQNEELLNTQFELETSRERYLDLFNTAPVGYITLNKKGRMIEINQTAKEMLDLPSGDHCDSQFIHYLHFEDRDILYLFQKKLYNSGKRQQAEVRLKKSDDTFLWVAIEGISVANADENTMFRLAISDISDRKAAEDENSQINTKLQQMQKLDSLGVLAGGIAHDFNNLLGGIFGYVELASVLIDEGDYIYAQKHLGHAKSVFNRTKSLTQQLLTFAKGGSPILKTVKLQSLVEESTRFSLSGSTIEPIFSIDSDLHPCDCDINQIGQVVDNIVINSKESMADGGEIFISAKNVSAKNPHDENSSSLEIDMVNITVRDQGQGIPVETLSKVCDPFFSTKDTGHGLGLSTVYSIVHRHDGWIEINSKEGEGTTFEVFLPASHSVYCKPVNKFSGDFHGEGTVLIMDDEQYLLDIKRTLLEKLGYSVVEATNGTQAIECFKAAEDSDNPISFSIFDLTVVNGMGGKEACEEILKINSDARIIVSSGYANDPIMKDPTKYGFFNRIEKPFRISEFVEVLRDISEVVTL